MSQYSINMSSKISIIQAELFMITATLLNGVMVVAVRGASEIGMGNGRRIESDVRVDWMSLAITTLFIFKWQ